MKDSTPGATDKLTGEEQERLLAILNFWHKLEFFIPFDLEQRIREADVGRIRLLTAEDLANSECPLWVANISKKYRLTKFNLYIGVFDKSETVGICENATQARILSDEERERGDLEGRTCFAKLTISLDGEPIYKSSTEAVSVSTVPWAVGQVRTRGLSALTHDNFDAAKHQLSELLQNFRNSRHKSNAARSQFDGNPLRPAEILKLNGAFCKWAKFSPSSSNLVAVIEALVVDAEQATRAVNKEDEDDKSEPEIDILNSFFIQDVERVIRDVRAGRIPSTLKDYLTPLDSGHRINFDSDKGLWAILDGAHPSRMNAGHWFVKPDQAMSLMQQFAVNTALRAERESRLFSVNGPPGTGKTTLLQDIFADLIVRRARVLATLEQASAAFVTGNLPVSFPGEHKVIRQLKPELTGFEMVVASSNNPAVENISKELPKAAKLHDAGWLSAQYLRPIAALVAANVENETFRVKPDDTPWGLISCALGNRSNRIAFKERVFFGDAAERPGPYPIPLQTIYEWLAGYHGPTFARAAADFKMIDEKVQLGCDRLSKTADMLRRNLAGADSIEVSELEARLAECCDQAKLLKAEVEQSEADRLKLERELDRLREDERLIERGAPGRWAKLRRSPRAKSYKNDVRENSSAQLDARRQRAALERNQAPLSMACRVAMDAVTQAEQKVRDARYSQSRHQAEWSQMRREFPTLRLPDSLDQLNTDTFQEKGLWHDPEHARLRSSLFAAALVLHEAWLAEAGKAKHLGGAGFGGNIEAVKLLLSSKRPPDSGSAAAIWQSLFMIVPVVSTTFASFANQFGDLGPASLGWLFIDEAGQAVPQAAVGALWRAQRAVVVGDPRQIEPVFTLPSRLIAALAQLSPHTGNGDYAPDKASVQTLADNANQFGVELPDGGNGSIWIGSPLRVHRRCIRPMFEWSNEIAYDGRMVYATEDVGTVGALETNWQCVDRRARKDRQAASSAGADQLRG